MYLRNQYIISENQTFRLKDYFVANSPLKGLKPVDMSMFLTKKATDMRWLLSILIGLVSVSRFS